MKGKTINGYTLQHLLGTGGMAEVWYAENRIRKKAAVKLLLPRFCADESIVSRFQNEAEVMVELEHPNIRQVYDYGDVEGRPAIVMEYLEGDDLKSMMKKGYAFSDDELRRWWNQMADALNYTHQIGIVHRDIKPSNIFIDTHGNVRLLDFGIAKNNEGGSGTQTGSTLGTRIYMSPEQVKDPKRVDYRTDLYSLAVTFVHLLTGKAPYDSTTSSDFEIQLNIVTKPLDLDGVPADWRAFLEPYLEKDPDKRPALTDFTEEKPSEPTMEEPVGPSSEQPSEENLESQEEDFETDEDATAMGTWDPVFGFRQTAQDDHAAVSGSTRKTTLKPPQSVLETEETVVEGGSAPKATSSQPKVRPPFNPQDLRIQVNGVSFLMKAVPGGTFWMGAHANYVKSGLFSKEPDTSVPNFDASAESDEAPVHQVTLSGFHLGETPVTQALWKTVMGDNPSAFTGDNRPVEQVNWDECRSFIERLNQLTGKNFRLPTEAEWEYAARGGTQGKGFVFSGSDNIGKVAWCLNNSESMTHPVKEMLPNELGLYDMSGNVREWCQDWYDDYAEEDQEEGQLDPQGPEDGLFKVVRGGGWYDAPTRCRVSARECLASDIKFNKMVGLRLAL